MNAPKGQVESEIRDVLNLLREQVGEDFVRIPSEKASALIQLAEYEAELLKMAQYRRAVNLLWDKWRGMIIGLAAVVTAGTVLMDKLKATAGGWLGQ